MFGVFRPFAAPSKCRPVRPASPAPPSLRHCHQCSHYQTNDSLGCTTDCRPAWNKCQLNHCLECINSFNTVRLSYSIQLFKRIRTARLQFASSARLAQDRPSRPRPKPPNLAAEPNSTTVAVNRRKILRLAEMPPETKRLSAAFIFE